MAVDLVCCGGQSSKASLYELLRASSCRDRACKYLAVDQRPEDARTRKTRLRLTDLVLACHTDGLFSRTQGQHPDFYLPDALTQDNPISTSPKARAR